MFLSQLSLNPRNAQVRSELAQPYEIHRTLLNAFPRSRFHVARTAEDAAGVLFRVEQNAGGMVSVLVQSQLAPDWAVLQTRRDARGHAYLIRAVEQKTFELQLVRGQMLSFRLRANPTKRRKSDGKRIGIENENEQLEWLRAKVQGDEKREQASGGFRLVRALVGREEFIKNKEAIHRADRSYDLKILAAQFDGLLQVDDPFKAAQTVARGIGSGKAFGFGLLSLARA
jgi:CRISPR system Cascade subunit CasE